MILLLATTHDTIPQSNPCRLLVNLLLILPWEKNCRYIPDACRAVMEVIEQIANEGRGSKRHKKYEKEEEDLIEKVASEQVTDVTLRDCLTQHVEQVLESFQLKSLGIFKFVFVFCNNNTFRGTHTVSFLVLCIYYLWFPFLHVVLIILYRSAIAQAH